MLYIASDHQGFKLKKRLIGFLKSQKIEYSDLGPLDFDPDDDYPDYAAKIARKVSKKAGEDKGILICKSGQGVCIAANKYKGIRAVLCWDEKSAKSSRVDDDANVLCLPSGYVSAQLAERILDTWLTTSFSFDKRHIRRLKKIDSIIK